MDKSNSLPAHEQDTQVLFEKYTVDEIRGIEKKTRTSIEKKKEDLRVMVGERYRDLIEAADVITDMKKSAENVMASIAKMEDTCTQIKQNHMIKGTSYQHRTKPSSSSREQELYFYGVAAQIKLLIDMPEKIWSAVDNQDYLTATRFYLLSRHINTHLHLDTQKSNILGWFPVLSRQWSAISHFKYSILHGCRLMLKENSASDQEIANGLCSIMFLEDSNPRQVFNEFLLARTNAVQQLLHPNHQGAGTKDQVCKLVKLIITTIHQIYTVFYSSDNKQIKVPCNLLLETVNQITTETSSQSNLLDKGTSISANCLPSSVTDFCPVLRTPPLPVASQQLHDNCTQWVNTCHSNVKSGVSMLLNFINTVKRLTDIRDAVWEHMREDDNLVSWSTVCELVLNKQLLLWEDFIRPLFLERVKTLVKNQLENTKDQMKVNVAKVLSDINTTEDGSLTNDMHFAKYIWAEASSDIPPNSAWLTSAAKSLSEGGGLIMKAKGHTQSVQQLCKVYDDTMKMLTEDNQHYLQLDNNRQDPDGGPFDKYADTDNILKFTRENCNRCLQELLDHMTDLVSKWKQRLKDGTDSQENIIIVCRILLVARICSGMSELVPNLEKCVKVNRDSKVEPRRSLVRSALRGAHKPPDDPLWSDIKTRLSDCQLNAFSAWSEYTAEEMTKVFSQKMVSVDGPAILMSYSKWEDIQIQEETEDGKAMSSSIKVPMQASWILLEFFHGICMEINRIGGHALNRAVLVKFLHQASDGLVDSFEHLLELSLNNSDPSLYPINQPRAMQLLFDVKVIQQVIPRKEESEENNHYQARLQKLIELLEEYIDPFDLDAFSPFIASNINKQAQKVTILYGSIVNLDRHGMLFGSSRPQSSGQQEQHNMLPLITCQNRFSLLPLSTESTASMTQQFIPQTINRASDGGIQHEAHTELSQAKPAKDGSSSFYDKLGSMWFSR